MLSPQIDTEGSLKGAPPVLHLPVAIAPLGPSGLVKVCCPYVTMESL